jgi:hypothetical protein
VRIDAERLVFRIEAKGGGQIGSAVTLVSSDSPVHP